MLAICFAVSALAAACTDPQSNTCGAAKCETIGDTQICTECATDGNVPINGVCKQKDAQDVTGAGCKLTSGANLAGTEKVCGQCDAANYFLYKGGCYSTSDATGQKLCTRAVDGVCTTAVSGYFIPPGATRTDQSIMACNDATEITLTSNSKKYVGWLTVRRVVRPLQQVRLMLRPPRARREGTCPCRDPPDPAGPLLPRHRPDSPALCHSRCTERACPGFARSSIARRRLAIGSDGHGGAGHRPPLGQLSQAGRQGDRSVLQDPVRVRGKTIQRGRLSGGQRAAQSSLRRAGAALCVRGRSVPAAVADQETPVCCQRHRGTARGRRPVRVADPRRCRPGHDAMPLWKRAATSRWQRCSCDRRSPQQSCTTCCLRRT